MLSKVSNDKLLEKRSRQRQEATGPLVGDFVLFPDPKAEGVTREERISHDWGEDIGVQTSRGGSFHLGDGFTSFSGSLNPVVPLEKLIDTGEVRQGRFWFFSGNWPRANNGVDVEAPCRVYRYAPEIDEQHHDPEVAAGE